MLNLFSSVQASCYAGCVLSVHCQALLDYTTTFSQTGVLTPTAVRWVQVITCLPNTTTSSSLLTLTMKTETAAPSKRRQ